MGSDMDLSIVGRDDCGHMRVDVELYSAFKNCGEERAYILVSLPMIARWHTSERFNAERILRQSGQFDYSEPQFFDEQNYNMRNEDLPGPLNLPEHVLDNVIVCEYESASLNSRQATFLNEPSTLPCHMVTVRVLMKLNTIDFMKYYGQLSHVFWMYSLDNLFLKRIRNVIKSGGDNNPFPSFSAYRNGQLSQMDSLSQGIF